MFDYTEKMIHTVLPKIREYSEIALRTANLTQVAKMETKPEYYMGDLMNKYMMEVEAENLIPYPKKRFRLLQK